MRQKPLIYRDSDGFSRCQFPDFIDLEHLNVGVPGTVEIDNGRITVTRTNILAIPGVTPSTKEINRIDGGFEGSVLILRCQKNTKVKSGGDLYLNKNCILKKPVDTLMLLKIGTGWVELSRSKNL